jgi:DNA polymerase sigma
MLAELLARRKHIVSMGEKCLHMVDGMEKVICVSTAKVPIVKIWDPELCLACDMNVNNTLALENTRMIKTYVQLDDRVRPLAMIIKYWTKRRVVNDAGRSHIHCC